MQSTSEEERQKTIVKLGGVIVGMRVVRHAILGTIIGDDGHFVTIQWDEDGRPLTTTRFPRSNIWQNIRLAHVGDR